MQDEAVILEGLHGVELFLARYLRINPVQLPQADALDAELAPTLYALLAQVFGAAIGSPGVGAAAREPRLGRDQGLSVWMQRFVNELLGNNRTVGIGRDNEIDAERRQPLQCADRFRLVRRRTPDTAAGDAHGAEAE